MRVRPRPLSEFARQRVSNFAEVVCQAAMLNRGGQYQCRGMPFLAYELLRRRVIQRSCEQPIKIMPSEILAETAVKRGRFNPLHLTLYRSPLTATCPHFQRPSPVAST